jgi:hypothetical protein
MEIAINHIENRIFVIRGTQVMLDRDLAEMYGVETKVLNQAVKRNKDRFPDTFRFQLSKDELDELVTNCDRFATLKHSSYRPFVFTEQGVAMLSAVLRSAVAVNVSIQIMQTFVSMRKALVNLHGIIQRLEGVEIKQLKTDEKLERVLQALEKDTVPKQGVFFEGQLFDAHVFVSSLIKQARKSVVLIDNYVDENTLVLLSKRKKNVRCIIYSKPKAVLLKDLEKFNRQYPTIDYIENHGAHDRFLMFDDSYLYHFGASLKDLGSKCFAFSRLDGFMPEIKLHLLNMKENNNL